MNYIIVLFIFLLFVLLIKREHFTQLDNLDIYENYDSLYNKNKYDKYDMSIITKLKPQKYLTFLDDVNRSMKSKAPITGAFRGSCDDKVNQKFQKESLKEAYMKIEERDHVSDNFKRDPCIAYANELCEFIDPMLYLSESTYSAPRWLIKTYDTHSLPPHTELNCFNTNYTCCKSSLR